MYTIMWMIVCCTMFCFHYICMWNGIVSIFVALKYIQPFQGMADVLHYSDHGDITKAPWHLKLQAAWLLVQQLIQDNKKKISKLCTIGPLCRAFTSHRWIPTTKDQPVLQKAFSCYDTVMEKYLVHGIFSHSVASGLWNYFKEISSRACFAFAVLKWLYIFACIVFLGTTKKGKIVCVFCYMIIYLQSSSFCDYI